MTKTSKGIYWISKTIISMRCLYYVSFRIDGATYEIAQPFYSEEDAHAEGKARECDYHEV